jgi:hypothetical protein
MAAAMVQRQLNLSDFAIRASTIERSCHGV